MIDLNRWYKVTTDRGDTTHVRATNAEDARRKAHAYLYAPESEAAVVLVKFTTRRVYEA